VVKTLLLIGSKYRCQKEKEHVLRAMIALMKTTAIFKLPLRVEAWICEDLDGAKKFVRVEETSEWIVRLRRSCCADLMYDRIRGVPTKPAKVSGIPAIISGYIRDLTH